MWIFGYGSLTWKTDFPFERKIIGYIKGYIRRFWQGSEDHRGVPGKPGRVVTIIPACNPEDRVYGVAYKIAEKDIAAVKNHLDYREKDGYEQHTVIFYPCIDGISPFNLSIYVANENNPFYLGPSSEEKIAEQIFSSMGPSGRNDEYLFQLAETMKSIGPPAVDFHLTELERLVTEMKSKCRQKESF